MTVYRTVLAPDLVGGLDVIKEDGDLSHFYNTVILKKEYLHNSETQYRIYQVEEDASIQFFVLTTKKEFFVKSGHPEKWETQVKGWL